MEPGVHKSFRGLLVTLAYLGALAVAITVPAIYFGTAYLYETAHAKDDAKRAANIVSGLIYSHPDTWRYQTLRLEEALSRASVREAESFIRIKDDKGEILFQLGAVPPAPRLTFARNLVEGSRILGKLELTESFRHLVVDTALVSLLGLVLGLFTFVIVGRLPVKALDRAARDIEASEKALRESEAHLTDAQRIAHLGSWERDIATGAGHWTDEHYRIFGLKPQQKDVTFDWFLSAVHPDDAEAVKEAIRRAIDEHLPYDLEYRIVRPGGEIRDVHTRGEVAVDDHGQPVQIAGTLLDITWQKRAEEEIRQSEKRLRNLADAVPVLIADVDAERRYRFANSRYLEWFDVKGGTLAGRRVRDVIGEQFHSQIDDHLSAVLRGTEVSFEDTFTYGNGIVRQFLATYIPQFGETGEVRGYYSLVQDLTEQKRVAEALRLSEERFKALYQASPFPSFSWRRKGDEFVLDQYNAAAGAFTEERIRDFVGVTAKEFYADRPEILGALERCLAAGETVRLDHEYRLRTTGAVKAQELTFVFVPPDLVVVDVYDLTERKRAEEALRDSEERFRSMVESAADAIFVYNLDGRFVDVNERACQSLGYTRSELLAMSVPDVEARVAPADSKARWSTLGSGTATFEGMHRRKDGSRFPVELNLRRFGAAGERLFIALARDITERKRAGEALKASEERFRALFDHAQTSIYLKDTDGRYLMVNRKFEEWTGYSASETVGRTAQDLFPGLDDVIRQQDREVIETGKPVERLLKVTHLNGTERTMLTTKFPVWGADGGVFAVGGVSSDLTERKRLEEQLIAAHKLEALGQVTGGVAHEFNNLLQAIISSLGILKDDIGDKARPARMVEIAEQAAARGANLTARLLSYVGKHPVRPETLDVGDLVSAAADMLRPTLGETIKVETAVADDVWPVEIDQAQIESALFNLALNARDAMADEGNITFAAANVHLDAAFAAKRPYQVIPGDYVKLAVSDDGTGMAPEVIDHAFDPFFTTKEVGQGTGLGLSMVFGFVRRQCGGYVDIESEIGLGTTVTLYLPRAESGAEQAAAPERAEVLFRGPGNALIVEDDASVLDPVKAMLEGMGFAVRTARNGREAREHLDKSEDLVLVLTDVVMPGGVDGIDLALSIGRTHPTTRVILMSGYPEEELAKRGLPKDGAHLLRKPFSQEELAAKVAAVFGSRKRG